MKLRTSDEILDFLDDEYAWRRKELTAIWNDVKSAAEKARAARIRAGVALLYAHWEGFVKATSDAYVDFVARRRPKLDELSAGFLALALRSRLQQFAKVNEVSSHVEFVGFLSTELASRAHLPTLGVIRTGANLNSARLKQIVLTLGLDYAPFELKANLLDSQLLNWRNQIAHGKFLVPDEAEFEVLYSEVPSLIRHFKDQLSNAVVLQTYLRPSAAVASR